MPPIEEWSPIHQAIAERDGPTVLEATDEESAEGWAILRGGLGQRAR